MRLGEVSESKVRCLVCGRVFKSLNSHLRTHSLTAVEYRERFPDALIYSAESDAKRRLAMSLGILAFCQTEEGKAWCHQQSVDAKVFAAENPGFYDKSPEHRRNIGGGVHQFHVEHPDAASEKMTPAVRQQISETVTKHHNEPAYKKQQSDTMTEYCAEHPDFRKKKPGQVEKQKASLARYLESPEGLAQRREHSESMAELGRQRYLDDPESFQSFIEAGQACVVWRDTKPELAMAAILTSLGLEVEPQGRIPELNKPHRHHKWDFIIRDLKIAVEVDGCYWHAHSECFPERLQEDVIKDQIALEEQRDLEADLSGWTVLRLWECEILEWPMHIAVCVQVAVEHQRRMAA